MGVGQQEQVSSGECLGSPKACAVLMSWMKLNFWKMVGSSGRSHFHGSKFNFSYKHSQETHFRQRRLHEQLKTPRAFLSLYKAANHYESDHPKPYQEFCQVKDPLTLSPLLNTVRRSLGSTLGTLPLLHVAFTAEDMRSDERWVCGSSRRRMTFFRDAAVTLQNRKRKTDLKDNGTTTAPSSK